MNWYKKAKQQEEEFRWNRFLKGFGVGTVTGLAIWLGLSVMDLKSNHAQNPQMVEQKAVEYQNAEQQEKIREENQPVVQPVAVQKVPTIKTETFDLTKVKEMIARHEGKSNKVYNDSEGIPTIGIGFNLQRPDAKAKIKAFGLDYDKILKKEQILTEAQIDSLYKDTLSEAVGIAKSFLSNFSEQPAVVQEVLINMSFNLGPGIRAFEDFNAALLKKDYKTAAAAMVNSKWHKQVGDRSIELEKMIGGIK